MSAPKSTNEGPGSQCSYWGMPCTSKSYFIYFSPYSLTGQLRLVHGLSTNWNGNSMSHLHDQLVWSVPEEAILNIK
jgi:hypothetical protein